METLSRKQNLTIREPTMTLEFGPPKLILLGNKEIALLNRTNSTNFIVLFLSYVLKMAPEVSPLSSVRLESVLIFVFNWFACLLT